MSQKTDKLVFVHKNAKISEMEAKISEMEAKISEMELTDYRTKCII